MQHPARSLTPASEAQPPGEEEDKVRLEVDVCLAESSAASIQVLEVNVARSCP